MSQLRVNGFSISLDGFGAGPGQDLQNPLGRNGVDLHRWLVSTRTFQRTHGDGEDGSAGTAGVDDDFAARSMQNLGAWILGRNMFGPMRGAWPDESWRGWWGDNPPYHVPVFVLTHHARRPLEMEGGTIFHFVTDGIVEALRRARAAAGTADVRLGGGAATIRQYLRARLVDELHLAVAPILLGGGESLFEGLDLGALGYRVAEHAASPAAMHVVIRRAPGA
jgi:dihydrofolate reductase